MLKMATNISINNQSPEMEAVLTELRRKIHLAGSKKRVNYEEGEEAKMKNQEYANQIKEEIGKLKSMVGGPKLELINVDHSIRALLGQQREPGSILELIEQWIYELQNKYNLLTHQEGQHKQKLFQLIAKKDELLSILSEITRDNRRYSQAAKKAQELENDFERLQMKTTEAEVVQKKYLSVKAIISDEILQLQKDINQQDDNIIKIKNELPQLIAVVENARQSNQLIEKQLNQQDELFQKQKNDWEKALMMYHQQVEEVQFSDTSEDEKSVEILQSSGDVYSGEESFPLLAEESINLNHIENNELLQHMKMTAGYDQQEFVKLLEQEDTKHRLDEIKAQFEQKITLLQEEKQKIEAKIEAVILSSDRKSNNLYEELQAQLRQQQRRKAHLLEAIEENRNLIESLHTTLRQLCMKIAQGCKMSAGVTLSPSPDDTLDLLMACTERLDLLVDQCRDYDRSNASKMYQGLKYNENVEEAQSNLKPKKKSQLEEPLLTAPNTAEDFESVSDQEILTRAMIKRQAKTVIDHYNKMQQKGPHRQKKT